MYNGYKKPEEHFSVCFRDDAANDPKVKIGSMIAIEYHNGRLSMVRVNWGDDEDWERSRDGEVELNWMFDEENTKKMMRLTGTNTGKSLINVLYERFKQNAYDADSYIIRWCDTKGIVYNYYVHY